MVQISSLTLVIGMLLGWFISVGVIFWLTRLHFRELQQAHSSHQAHLLVLSQHALLMSRATDATEAAQATAVIQETAAWAGTAMDTDLPDHGAPEVTGMKLMDGTEVDFLRPPDPDIIKEADEDVLLRRT